MEITEAQYSRIEPILPRQRENVSMSNLNVLNAILYVAEQGCKWRGLPHRFGNWHSIYTRMNRWSKKGVLDTVFEKLQREQVVRIKIEAFSLDSTSVKVHPDGTGALKKTDRSPSASRAEDGTPRFIWLPYECLDRFNKLSSTPSSTRNAGVGAEDGWLLFFIRTWHPRPPRPRFRPASDLLRIYFPPVKPGVLRTGQALHPAGLLAVDALRAIAAYWRPITITDTTTWEDVTE